jgi:hypothetical protein
MHSKKIRKNRTITSHPQSAKLFSLHGICDSTPVRKYGTLCAFNRGEKGSGCLETADSGYFQGAGTGGSGIIRAFVSG